MCWVLGKIGLKCPDRTKGPILGEIRRDNGGESFDLDRMNNFSSGRAKLSFSNKAWNYLKSNPSPPIPMSNFLVRKSMDLTPPRTRS